MTQLSLVRPSTRGYIEPFLGAGAVLLALLDPSLVPGWGYMGGKRKHAFRILASLGRHPGEGASEIILSEAGPLGWVWSELVDVRRAGWVAEVLRGWQPRGNVELWNELVETPPMTDPSERAAQVLWLQARMATCCPLVGWSESAWRWEMGDKLRVGNRPGRQGCQMDGHAVERAQKVAFQRKRAKGKGLNARSAGGILSTLTAAARVEAIAAALSRVPVRFIHGDISEAIPTGDLSGWDIYWDPPYVGATSYAADCSRARLLALVSDTHERGANNTVSEAVPLPLHGWRHVELTRPGGKPEWLTCSRPAQSWRTAA